ncbi:MAG: ribonuclease III [Acidaminococcaceae bacterium]|nr:ribonuclease III [Acidaminococcaceae bacterium]
MKFEQYQKLRDLALKNCLEEGQAYPEPAGLNPIVLAYIGDVVFSGYVRLRLLPNSGQVRVLHDLAARMVSAVCQAGAMHSMAAELTEEETGVYHRGRNAKSMVPKSASVQEYREATAFEALVGYLYLEQRPERCEELMAKAFRFIVKHYKEGKKCKSS